MMIYGFSRSHFGLPIIMPIFAYIKLGIGILLSDIQHF